MRPCPSGPTAKYWPEHSRDRVTYVLVGERPSSRCESTMAVRAVGSESISSLKPAPRATAIAVARSVSPMSLMTMRYPSEGMQSSDLSTAVERSPGSIVTKRRTRSSRRRNSSGVCRGMMDTYLAIVRSCIELTRIVWKHWYSVSLRGMLSMSPTCSPVTIRGRPGTSSLRMLVAILTEMDSVVGAIRGNWWVGSIDCTAFIETLLGLVGDVSMNETCTVLHTDLIKAHKMNVCQHSPHTKNRRHVPAVFRVDIPLGD